MDSSEKTVRVFISSTFRDMHAERDHLVTVVFPELRERLERLGLEFFDVDLRWGVPEKDANGETANSWEYCRQWIDRVEPFFVCILGQRYGWVPEPEKLKDEGEQKLQREHPRSITDMEVRHAVLDSQRKRHSYFYLRKTKVPKSEQSICSEFVDPPDLQNKLDELKNEIRSCSRPVRDYACQWTGDRFVELQEFGDQVLEDLWSGVLRDERYVNKEIWQEVLDSDPNNDPRYTDASEPLPPDLWEQLVALAKPEPLSPLDAEQQQMQKFADSRLRWFHGRTKELKSLTEFVNSTDPETQSLAAVAAMPGHGKSALLSKLWKNLQEVCEKDFILAHFVGATERSADSRSLVLRILDELDRNGFEWPEKNQEEYEEPKLYYNVLCLKLANRLGSYDGKRNIILLIDALNQLSDGHNLNWLPHRLGPNIRVVVSCVDDPNAKEDSPEHTILSALKSRHADSKWVPLDALTPDDIRTIVIEYLKEYCKELDEEHLDAICDMKQAGNPLYLLVMLDELRSLGGNEMNKKVPESIASMPSKYPDTVSLFKWVLERREVIGKEAVHLWCIYLSLGRVGMASQELADLLKLRLGKEGERTALLIERGMRRYLQRRGGQLDFFHGELRQAVMEHYGESASHKDEKRPGQSTKIHREIAEYFTTSAKGTDPQKEWETNSVRGFSECVFHLTKTEQYERAADLLTNFPFLLHKLRLGLLEGVFEDYNIVRREAQAEVATQLEIWADFFRERAHILRRGNAEWPPYKILVQLATDHADDSPITQAVEAWLSMGKCDWTWFRAAQRPRRRWKNACIAVMSNNSRGVAGACALEDKRILSWSFDGSLQLWSRNGSLLTTLAGHSDLVCKVIVRRNGGFVSQSRDGTVRLWSNDGQTLATLGSRFTRHKCAKELQDGRILSWSEMLHLWSGNGELQVALDADKYSVKEMIELEEGRVLFWSYGSCLSIWTLGDHNSVLLRGHGDDVMGARQLRDGRILSWSKDGTLRLWTQEGRPIKTMAGHIGVVNGAKILSDSRILSWSADWTLRLWSNLGDALISLRGHTEDIVGAKELANGDIMSWSKDGTVRIWTRDGVLRHTVHSGLPNTNGSIEKICELNRDRVLFVGFDHTIRLVGSDGTNAVCEGFRNLPDFVELSNGSIVVWDCFKHVILNREGVQIGVLEHYRGKLRQLSTGDLLTFSDNGTVKVWSLNGGIPELRHQYQISFCDFVELSSEHLLAWDGSGSMWLQTLGGEVVATFDGHTAEVEGASVLSDGRIMTWSKDCSIRLWNRQGTPQAVLVVQSAHITDVIEMCDSRLLSWSADARLRIWTARGELLVVLEGHTDAINGALELACGRILSWSKDSTLRLWAMNGTALCELSGHTDEVLEARELPDGRFLSWSKDGTTRMWTNRGLPIAIMEGKNSEILDDGRVVTWTKDDKLLLWSGGGRFISTLLDQPREHHSNWDIQSIQKLSGGRWFSSLKDDYSWHLTNRIWSAEGHLLATMEGEGKIPGIVLSNGRFLIPLDQGRLRLWSDEGTAIADLEGHVNRIEGILELSDQRLLSWSLDSTLRLWSVDGVPLAILEGHTDTIMGASELSDGLIMSWSIDGTLRLWKLPSDAFEFGGEAKSAIGQPGGVNKGNDITFWKACMLADGRILSWLKKRLYMWSKKGELLEVLGGHSDSISWARQLSTGTIVSWSMNKNLRFWAADGKSLAELPGAGSIDGGVAELADGRLLSWSPLRISSQKGEPIAFMGDESLDDTHHERAADGVRVLSDQRILSWSWGYLYIWTEDGRLHRCLEGHERSIDEALELSDGRILSCSGRDGTVRLWTADGQPLKVLKGHTAYKGEAVGNLSSVLELPDGRLVSWGFAEHSLRLWTSEGDLLEIIHKWGVGSFGKVIYLSTGSLLFPTDQGSLRLWLADGGQTISLHGPSGRWLSGALELSAGRILTWSKGDDRLWLWSAEGIPLAALRGHMGKIGGALQLDDSQIVTWGDDRTIRLWTVDGLRNEDKGGPTTILSDVVAMSVDDYLEPVLLGLDGTVLTFNHRAEAVVLCLCKV